MNIEQEKVLYPSLVLRVLMMCLSIAFVQEGTKNIFQEAVCSDCKNEVFPPFFKTAWYSDLNPLVNT